MPKTVEKVPKQLPPEIKDVTGMFSLSSNFNQDISNWDVSNVKEHKNFVGNSGITDPNKLPKFPN